MPHKNFNRLKCRTCGARVEPVKFKDNRKRLLVPDFCSKKCSPSKSPGGLRKFNLKYRYGLTVSKYEQMLVEQKKRCAICRLETKLFVDHNHKTTKVRGLLCRSCNTGIGSFGDEPILLKIAFNYLNSYEHKSNS